MPVPAVWTQVFISTGKHLGLELVGQKVGLCSVSGFSRLSGDLKHATSVKKPLDESHPHVSPSIGAEREKHTSPGIQVESPRLGSGARALPLWSSRNTLGKTGTTLFIEISFIC